MIETTTNEHGQTVKLTNNKYKNTEAFKNACAVAGIAPTKRQASKFRNGKGLAFAQKQSK